MHLAGRTPDEEDLLLNDMVDVVIDWMVEAVSFDGLPTE